MKWGTLLLVSVLWCSTALAAAPEQLVAESGKLLRDSQAQEAIRRLEAAADDGIEHPDLSFNRGLAYMSRAGSAAARPGDWGQAAAAFSEALELRPGDVQAERALEESQLAVSRKRAQARAAGVTEPLGLVEKAIYGLHPSLLFILAAIGSLLACVGVVLRLSQKEMRRTAGVISWGLSALLLLPAVALAQARIVLFQGSHVAVVVAEQAHLLDETGRRLKPAESLAESTRVHVGPARHGLVPLVSFGEAKWIRLAQVRRAGPNNP